MTESTTSDLETGHDVPAESLEPRGQWDDLALSASHRQAIDEIIAWLAGEAAAGSWALLRGPGAETAEIAALIGRDTGRAVYRIDLSKIISKYIGETEKNVDRLFADAASTNAILYLDAETFRRRKGPVSDRAQNQQIGHLLQSLEEYRGTVLLATRPDLDLDEELRSRCRRVVDLAPARRSSL